MLNLEDRTWRETYSPSKECKFHLGITNTPMTAIRAVTDTDEQYSPISGSRLELRTTTRFRALPAIACNVIFLPRRRDITGIRGPRGAKPFLIFSIADRARALPVPFAVESLIKLLAELDAECRRSDAGDEATK